MWSLLGFILILIVRKNCWLNEENFLSYVIWYSFGRFFIEGMRTDSLYAFGGIRVSQVLSLILLSEEFFCFIIGEKTYGYQAVRAG